MEYSILVMKKQEAPAEQEQPFGASPSALETRPQMPTLIVAPDKKALHSFIRENAVRPHDDPDQNKQGAHQTGAGETVFFFKNPPVVLKPQYRA